MRVDDALHTVEVVTCRGNPTGFGEDLLHVEQEGEAPSLTRIASAHSMR